MLTSGNHKFDIECKKDDIEHRLTAPATPKTNGMVERANGTIKNSTADSFQQPPYSSNITTHHSNSLLETSKVKTAEKIDGNISAVII